MNPGRGTVSGCLYRANFENSCKILGLSEIWSSTHGRPQPPRIASLWAPVTIPKRSGETCDCAACLLLFPGAQTRSGEILVNSCNSCNFENCLIPPCIEDLAAGDRAGMFIPPWKRPRMIRATLFRVFGIFSNLKFAGPCPRPLSWSKNIDLAQSILFWVPTLLLSPAEVDP